MGERFRHDDAAAADRAAALELELYASLRGDALRRAFARAIAPAPAPVSIPSSHAAAPPRPAFPRARTHADRNAPAPSALVVLAAAAVLQLAVLASSALSKTHPIGGVGAPDAHVASLLDRCDNLRLLR